MNQNIFFDNNQDKSVRNLIQSRLQHFQNKIRKTEVEQRINSLRQQLLNSICEDYATLRTINLQENIKQLLKIDVLNVSNQMIELDRIIKNMHEYGISERSDHMYLLFDDLIVNKLLPIVDWRNISVFNEHSRLYIKIVWILSKYTNYTTEVPVHFLQTMGQILKNVLLIPNYYQDRKSYEGFSHSQIKHIIIVLLSCLANLGLERPQFYSFFLDSQDGFISIALQECEKILRYWRKHIFTSNDYEIVIMVQLIKIFQKILSLYCEDQDIMNVVFNFDFKIIESALGILTFIQNKMDSLQIEIAQMLRLFFITHLAKSPKIIISHSYIPIFQSYKRAAQKLLFLNYQIYNFNQRLEIQGEVRQSLSELHKQCKNVENILIKWLKVLQLIFGLNIPSDENEKLYYDRYVQWIEQYFIPVTLSLFKVNELSSQRILQIHTSIIADLCLEQQFCGIIIDELPIVSRIFYHCKSDLVKIKTRKSSLNCLSNMIRISLDGPSQIRESVMEIMQKNRIVEILAVQIGEYVDENVNENMLLSLKILLENEPTQSIHDNLVWMEFSRCGGAIKLRKLFQCVKTKTSSEVARWADYILSKYDESDI